MTLFPRQRMLLALWLTEKAFAIVPDTREGKVLKNTLANYFQRKRLIEQEILFPEEETRQLAREFQARASLSERNN